jgi:uncharacterized membrane protein (DUF373 family)
LETLLAKIQRFTVWALAGMLVIILLLSRVHLGVLIGEEIWKPPRFLISVQSLFECFLLVLIGVEFLETLKSYMKNDVIHVRVVLRGGTHRHGARPSSKNPARCQP